MATTNGPVVANSEIDDALFGEEDFDAPSYVRDQLKDMKSGDEMRHIQALRASLNAISSQSAEAMKKSVFMNYQKFIDTSKEVSHLEREIYELSSLLTEQRAMLEALMQMSGEDRASVCTSSSAHNSSSFIANPLNVLMQKIGGIASVLNNLSSTDRIITYGEVTQLDNDNMRPLHNAMLILLSDRLVICHPSSGKYRFQMDSTHSLNNLAAVNIKDREGGERASSSFKLLIFPEQRIFMAESPRMKKEWLDAIENAKRELLHEGSLVRQATIRGKRRQEQSTKTDAPTGGQLPPIGESTTRSPDETAWLRELPAELDDCIAHRDMDQAIELVLEWKSCNSRDVAIDAQMMLRETQIVQLLCEEVRRPGALHGGPRAVKKAISLLTALGRGSQAVDLYLRKRSTVLRTTTRELTVSEEPLSYVRQLSQQFVDVISDVVTEFSLQPEYFSLILHWCSSELSVLLSLIRRHVIEVAPTMAVLAHTWRILMTHCDNLVAVGVDLSFEVHRLLAPSLKIAIETNFTNIIESIRLRISEERWRVYNMESESNVNRFLEEMSDMGLTIDWALTSNQRSSINITQNACHFSRVAYSLARDLAVLRSSHLRSLTDSFMVKLWTEYLDHLSSAPESPVQQYTSMFIVSQLLQLCDNIYEGTVPALLSELLETKYKDLLKYRSDENGHAASEDEEEVAHV